MTLRSKLLLAGILIATPLPGLAAARLSGAGGETCADFSKRGGPDDIKNAPALQWVMGYLTGRASSSTGPHRPFRGPDGIAASVAAFCSAHPEAQIDQAARDFFDNSEISATHDGGP